jgi:pimeloyl-ACP methyl ester carboxylesterase|tara:strand:- start:442 stop:1047 length:606 start_codon:yes stop_codon:yes gene_type:complete
MKNIIYLHGANASPDNFNYYTLKLPEHNYISPEYNMEEDPYDLVELIRLRKQREFGKQKVILVGHSFGGLLASWYASVYPRSVEHLVTIATPWEGTPVARVLSMIFRNKKVFENTKPGAEVLSLLQEKTFNGVHTNIVCTSGSNPLAGLGGKANDGMISVDSQLSTPAKFKNSQNFTIEAGHSGVLLNNTVTDMLQKILEE